MISFYSRFSSIFYSIFHFSVLFFFIHFHSFRHFLFIDFLFWFKKYSFEINVLICLNVIADNGHFEHNQAQNGVSWKYLISVFAACQNPWDCGLYIVSKNCCSVSKCGVFCLELAELFGWCRTYRIIASILTCFEQTRWVSQTKLNCSFSNHRRWFWPNGSNQLCQCVFIALCPYIFDESEKNKVKCTARWPRTVCLSTELNTLHETYLMSCALGAVNSVKSTYNTSFHPLKHKEKKTKHKLNVTVTFLKKKNNQMIKICTLRLWMW